MIGAADDRRAARPAGYHAARFAAVAVGAAILAAGCRRDMADQPRYEPYEASDFFADGRADRPPVPGTVPRTDDAPAPARVTRDLLERGRERYDIFCSPCHDRTGEGQGMIVRRGYRQPPSFHIDRLRAAKDDYLNDVITNGFGAMPDYRKQIPAADRHAIVAYLRALQRSQRATIADVPPADRAGLAAETAP